MDWHERIGRRLQLWDLSILLTAIEAGSMSKAAQRLRVSQPAISKTIALLEREAGCKLVQRSSRGIEPTEDGRAMIARAQAALRELGDACDDVAGLADPKTGQLRLAANAVALSSLVGPVINRLHALYPAISFEIVPAYTQIAQLHELRQGRVDLVVGQAAHPTDARDIETTPLFQEQLVVGAGADNPWSRRAALSLADLMNEPWAFPPLDSVSGRTMEEAFRAEGLGLPRIAVIASSLQLIRRLVLENETLALFPGSVAQSTPGIRILPVTLKSPWQPIGVLTLRGRTASPLARLFIDAAHAVARESGDQAGQPGARPGRRRKPQTP